MPQPVRSARHTAVSVSPQHPARSIHRTTDAAADALAAFTRAHPEYAKLAPEAVEQAMSTYRTDEEHRVMGWLRDEGVPVDRRTRWSDDV